MPTKKKTSKKTLKKNDGLREFHHFEGDFKKDAKCNILEFDDGLETLRFIKRIKLDQKTPNYNSKDVEKMIDKYREDDALAFARTIKRLLSKDDSEFRDLLLENAEARLREHKNRLK